MTISCWVYAKDLGPHQRIINKWESGSYVYALNLSSSGYFFEVLDAPENAPSSVSVESAVLNEWTHIVSIYDSENIKIYINGTLENTVPYDRELYQGDTPLYIGKGESDIDLYFNGLIDDVRIYNRTLIDSEISELYSE